VLDYTHKISVKTEKLAEHIGKLTNSNLYSVWHVTV